MLRRLLRSGLGRRVGGGDVGFGRFEFNGPVFGIKLCLAGTFVTAEVAPC